MSSQEYSRVVYGTARIHVSEGMYTRDQLVALLAQFDATQERMRAALEQSIQPIEKKP